MASPTVSLGKPDEAGLVEVTITGMVKMPGWTFHVTVRPPFVDNRGERHPPAEVGEVGIAPPSGSSFEPNEFRRIPYGEMFRLARGAFTNPMLAVVAEAVGAEIGPRPYRGGIDHSRAVAAIYRAALGQDLNPRQAIAETYGVSTKTVDRWLAEARKTTDPDTGQPVLGDYSEELAEHGFSAAMKRARANPKTTAPTKGTTRKRTDT